MRTTKQTSLVLVIVITTAAVAAAATTTQIQPAYSQATHCAVPEPGVSLCEQPGKDPSITICGLGESTGCENHHSGWAAGHNIGTLHNLCVQTTTMCTVIPPKDQ